MASRTALNRSSPVRVTKLPQANRAHLPEKMRLYFLSSAARRLVVLGQQAQEEQVGNLLDGIHRVVDAARPEDVHQLVDLLAQAGGEEIGCRGSACCRVRSIAFARVISSAKGVGMG